MKLKICMGFAALLIALTSFSQNDSMVTAVIIPVSVKTTTYKLLVKQPTYEKFIYSTTSESIAYDGNFTIDEDKKHHFTVFKFSDKNSFRQYYLIYNYRDKKLYQTEWFDKSAVGDKLLSDKVDFKKRQVKVQLGEAENNIVKVKLTESKDQP